MTSPTRSPASRPPAWAAPLKVIIETCLLSDMEKIKLCQLAAKEEVAYVKTSTGFSTAVPPARTWPCCGRILPASVKVKASGGIRTLEDGQAYLDLGADRPGRQRPGGRSPEAEVRLNHSKQASEGKDEQNQWCLT